MAETNYAMWLRAGSNAAAIVTVAAAHLVDPDDGAYLAELQTVFVDMSPTDIALTCAWLGNFTSRALTDCFEGEVDEALGELQRVALSIAEGRLKEL